MIAHLYHNEEALCGVYLEVVPKIGETIMLCGPVVHEVPHLVWVVTDVRHLLSSTDREMMKRTHGVAIDVTPHKGEN